jgi:hypothetical protein
MTDDRQEPLSSEEMIKRARTGPAESSDDLIRRARDTVSDEPDLAGLENIEIEIPIADEFPEPIPQIQTASRPRRVRRRPTQAPTGPVSSDDASRVVVFAVALMVMLIAIGVFVAIAASAP